jgi:hypothetical protein
MGLFTNDIYIPQTLYRFLPLLYATAGLLMWLFFENTIGQLAGIALVVFALVITIKRFSRSPND